MKSSALSRPRCIPPLAVTLAAGLGAWLAARVCPALCLEWALLPAIATVVGLLGAGCCALGVAAFRRARTTVNPLRPGAATSLVVSGIYGLTRNPMYLGFLLLLLAEIIWLGSALAVLAAPALVLYLDRFQIAPEERALRARFGADFIAYAACVPRWL